VGAVKVARELRARAAQDLAHEIETKPAILAGLGDEPHGVRELSFYKTATKDRRFSLPTVTPPSRIIATTCAAVVNKRTTLSHKKNFDFLLTLWWGQVVLYVYERR